MIEKLCRCGQWHAEGRYCPRDGLQDPRPSLTLQTVTDTRLRLVREMDADWGEVPPMTRVGRVAAVTLSISMAIIGLGFVVQMLMVP